MPRDDADSDPIVRARLEDADKGLGGALHDPHASIRRAAPGTAPGQLLLGAALVAVEQLRHRDTDVDCQHHLDRGRSALDLRHHPDGPKWAGGGEQRHAPGHEGAAQVRLGGDIDGALGAVRHDVDDEGGDGLGETVRREVLKVQHHVALRDRFQGGLELRVAPRRVVAEPAVQLERGRDRPGIGRGLQHVALIDEPQVVGDEGRCTDGHHRHRNRRDCGRSGPSAAGEARERGEEAGRVARPFRPGRRSGVRIQCHRSSPAAMECVSTDSASAVMFVIRGWRYRQHSASTVVLPNPPGASSTVRRLRVGMVRSTSPARSM